MKRRTLIAAAAVAAFASIPPAVQAQAVSRILTGYPPGGAVDVLARVFAEELTRETGKTWIVETRTGAGGQIAADALKAAAPDGNTLLMAAETNMVIYPHTVKRPTYDPLKDFTPVALAGNYEIGFAIRNDPRAGDFRSWVGLARTDAATAAYASPGPGSNMHFYGLTLSQAIGVPLTHVPYRGSGPAINDVISGVAGSVLTPIGTLMQHAKAGSLKIAAVSADKRNPKLPDVPTFKELGYPQLTQTGWFGLFAPAGLPPQQLTRLNEVLVGALAKPAVQQRLESLDIQAQAITPAAFAARVREEHAQWGKIVKASGFTADGQ
jgi:tripartite-type tricarboxylate transporter receptor subunit TctC